MYSISLPMDEIQEYQPTNENSPTFSDTESVDEWRRLVLEDAMFTETFTPLLPPPLGAATAPKSILDIACGTGIWATHVAKAYPYTSVIGIDNSRSILEYARLQAQGEGVSNVAFEWADCRSLDQTFTQEHFDFVQARQILWHMGAKGKELVQQWSKLLKPGGMMRLIDWEASTTNSPSFNQLTEYLMEALYSYGLSDSKHRVGTVYHLAPYLKAVGFSQIATSPYYIDFSSGAKYHNIYVQDITQGAMTLQPFIVGSKVVTAESYRECLRQSIEEIDQPHFLGGHFFLSVVGVK